MFFLSSPLWAVFPTRFFPPFFPAVLFELRKADATGLKICALAGYDPRKASEFMERFAQFEDGRKWRWVGWGGVLGAG